MTLLIAASALLLSLYSAWRVGRSEARNQFAMLGDRFAQVYARLPHNVSEKAFANYTDDEKSAADAYWSLCYLEWRSTRGANRFFFRLRSQWTDFYRYAQMSGFSHPGLRTALLKRLDDDPAVTRAWGSYLHDLSQALAAFGWRAAGPDMPGEYDAEHLPDWRDLDTSRRPFGRVQHGQIARLVAALGPSETTPARMGQRTALPPVDAHKVHLRQDQPPWPNDHLDVLRHIRPGPG